MLNLFLEFFKIGLFSVGGGLTTIPFLYELASKYPTWLNDNQILDMMAISQSTPGPFGINMSTFVGYNTYGILGAFISTSALILPSLIIIVIISFFYEKYEDNKNVQKVFVFLRVASLALISFALYRVFNAAMLVDGELNYIFLLIGAVFLILIRIFKKVPLILWIIIAAVSFIIFS